MKNSKDIGKFFIQRIQIFQGKYLLAIPGKKSFENMFAVILNEDTLKIIQNKFRNKKYYKNYNKYGQICYPDGKLDKKIIHRCVKTFN